MRLVLQEAYAVCPQETRLDQFLLMFQGPLGEALLPQGYYPATHAALGEFQLWLAHCEQDEAGLYYQSGFSRLR